jgi:hypothetical protein
MKAGVAAPRPPHETLRALAFALGYVAALVLLPYADDPDSVYWLALLFQPVFGFVLARWWGFLLAPVAVAIAFSVGPLDLGDRSEALPLWVVELWIAPLLAVLILAGFAARVAFDRLRARPS